MGLLLASILVLQEGDDELQILLKTHTAYSECALDKVADKILLFNPYKFCLGVLQSLQITGCRNSQIWLNQTLSKKNNTDYRYQ